MNYRLLYGSLTFLSGSGFPGGIPLLLDPTGSLLGLPISFRDDFPRGDYFVIGFFLAGVYGLGPLALLIGVLRRIRGSLQGCLALGSCWWDGLLFRVCLSGINPCCSRFTSLTGLILIMTSWTLQRDEVSFFL